MTGPLVVAIERAWAAIQHRHPDVPDVVLTVGSGSARPGQLTFGHFHDGKWATGEARLPELFVGGEGLARGPRAVLGTLLHEAAHGVAATRGIKDTSRQGRYHNARFRDLATELGIAVERDPSIGWSITTVPDSTAHRYAPQIAALDAAISAHRLADVHGTRARTSNNGLVATCECDPRRKIRLSRTAYDSGPISCGVCETEFTARDADHSSDTTREGRVLAHDITAAATTNQTGEPVMDETQTRTADQAVRAAVVAREYAHQLQAQRVLRAAWLHATGVDEDAATGRAAVEAVEATRQARLHQHSLNQQARANGMPAVDEAAEDRALAEPVTTAAIDSARSDEDRACLIDRSGAEQALVELRRIDYAQTARDAADLYLEYRHAHGRDPDQARAQTTLEVAEAMHSVYEINRDRAEEAADQRRTAAMDRTDTAADHARKANARGATDRNDSSAVGDWLRDQLTRDQDQARQRGTDSQLHQHKATTSGQPASASERAHLVERRGDDVEPPTRRDDPVQQARIAVDALTARRRTIEQHTTRAREDQLSRWHDDRAAESHGRMDGRGIDRPEAGR